MQENPQTNSGLTDEQLAEFRELLLNKRNQLLGNVHSIEHDTFRRDTTDSFQHSSDPVDVGSDNYDLENSLSLMDSERRILREIDEALERMERGEYGICMGTGKPIGLPRLRAIPWTKYSVEFANLLEQGLAFVDENGYGIRDEDDSSDEDADAA